VQLLDRGVWRCNRHIAWHAAVGSPVVRFDVDLNPVVCCLLQRVNFGQCFELKICEVRWGRSLARNTSESLFAPALRAEGSVLLLMATVSVSKL